MRLKNIKLSGFKSFVDATKIPFPTNLSAIVGPNGCGKSNTIDAVRWVMGESSAKYLRGESKTDVIFNGSHSRQPVGQCDVELVFDNTDRTLKGAYAAFDDVSIRRRVTREGVSTYFLNGTKCRRKDVTDLFLGTGLGPRSYAIIEQGMISRLIESKPEDLRVYIEEAAGISRYKERRRDTENRIRRTRENLERLTDLRDELGRQLQHLHRQAQAAEKYKRYKADEREKKAQLLALRWQTLANTAQTHEQSLAKADIQFEQAMANQRRIEADIAIEREKTVDVTEAFESVQTSFYELGNDVARLEQAVKFQQERFSQLDADIQDIQRQLHEMDVEVSADRDGLEEKQEALAFLEPELELAFEASETASEAVEQTLNDQQDWQRQWDAFTQSSQGPKRHVDVAQSSIARIERTLEQLKTREANLRQEKSSLNNTPQSQALEQLIEHDEQLSERAESHESELETLIEQRDAQNDRLRIAKANLEELSTQLREKSARQATVAALIKQLTSDAGEGVQHWLVSQQLREAEHIASQLQVESGWALAVETVLSNALQAFGIPSLDNVANALPRFNGGELFLIEQGSQTTSSHASSSLLGKVTSPFELSHWLANVTAVETLDDALALRPSLTTTQSCITRDGYWFGPNWVKVSQKGEDQGGLLSLVSEKENLDEQVDELEVLEEDQSVTVDMTERELQASQAQLESLLNQRQRIERERSDVRAQRVLLQSKATQAAEQSARLDEEIDRLNTQILDEREELEMSREALQEALESIEDDAEQHEQLLQARETISQQLNEQQDQLRSAQACLQQRQSQQQRLQAEINAAQTAGERTHLQKERLQKHLDGLLAQKAQLASPDDDLATQLNTALEQRVVLEAQLKERRTALEQANVKVNQLEAERVTAENAVLACRETLERERFELHSVKSKQSALAEQLREDQFDLTTLLNNLPEDATEQSWQDALTQLANKVQRLGPINLAAIDEYEASSERKRYLDEQDGDLQRALEVLESAIRKIDKETKARFKDTFDQVNKGLADLFPKVFGGGHAYLDLTSDDLLATGVTIMAQPPGKRNATIHLLSGGEKALTAIALVFAIFRLNPAPFCMLDEVDAPLDDANVTRYAKLVEAMSEHVQFIYITHNKGAMEMAHQLMGVTMNEPGVSRLVSVNVEEAAELAAQ